MGVEAGEMLSPFIGISEQLVTNFWHDVFFFIMVFRAVSQSGNRTSIGPANSHFQQSPAEKRVNRPK